MCIVWKARSSKMSLPQVHSQNGAEDLEISCLGTTHAFLLSQNFYRIQITCIPYEDPPSYLPYFMNIINSIGIQQSKRSENNKECL